MRPAAEQPVTPRQSRDQMLACMAELAGAFQAPIAKMLGLLVAPVRTLGYALGAYRDKLAAQGGGAEPGPAAES